MSRLSFGPRAGGPTDCPGHTTPAQFSSRGPLDALEALAAALKAEIETAGLSAVPECTTSELSLSLSAILPLVRPAIGPYASGQEHDLPSEFQQATPNPDGTPWPDAHPRAACHAVVNCHDPKGRQIVQRAASRGIIAAVEGVDGFRYSFNNAWAAKDEEGSRFSYVCQDSMQNKDRHANGFARTLKHLKGVGESGARKETYDCKGSVSVKFSSNRQSVDVHYRHYAIHDTVANRRPPARPGPRRAEQGLPPIPRQPKEAGGVAAALQAERTATPRNSASSAFAMVDHSPMAARNGPSNIGRPLKRKRESGPPQPQHTDPGTPLSLVELLKQSETASAPTVPSFESKNPFRHQTSAAPVAYELPSWQTPPPKLNAQPQSGPYPAPYPLPYQPTQRQAENAPVPALPPATPAARQPPQNHNVGLLRGEVTGPAHPQAQGLFTTMKPTSNEISTPSTYPQKKSTRTNVQATPTRKDPTRPTCAQQPAAYQTPQSTPLPSSRTPQERNAANYRQNVGPMTFNTFHQPTRATRSCTNCRHGKKKCDEQRPICGACAKSRKTDCVFEGTSHVAWQNSSSSVPIGDNTGRGAPNHAPPLPKWENANRAPPAGVEVREEIPDPWFPKR